MVRPAISILTVDDEQPFLDIIKPMLELDGYFVNTANDGVQAINILQSIPFDLVLLDVKMPRVDGVEVLKFIKEHYFDIQVVMLTGVSDVKMAVECMQLGAYSYLTKPCSANELMTSIDRALERRRLLIQNKALKSEIARHAAHSHIVGQSKVFLDMLTLASRVAPTDSTVLIQGASGTGKELIAQFLHTNSPRKENPFVALSCVSIPETLIESELFGHEKGAFTDAIAMKQGLVEIASNGTLFLDEVGELSPIIQPKLLRFLQTGEYRRVGSNKSMKADVRLISATNKELHQEVAAGRFREDLLYRLNVITLNLPPLHERKDDIPALIDHFLKSRFPGKEPRSLDDKALELLMRYEWPGNVRELENVIERASILASGQVIHVEDLALPLGTRRLIDPTDDQAYTGPRIGSQVAMVEIEKAHIRGVLKAVSWNKINAAKILGISLKTLYTKIQQFNLVNK